jgi:hypothetical protein
MKNKKLLILIVLVVGVWGTIGVKVYQSMTEDEVYDQPVPRRLVKDTVVEEKYELSLVYTDPFLKSDIKPKPKLTIASKKPVVKTKPKPVVSNIDWNYVKYLGAVYNASRKTKTASVRLGNSDHLMKEGESVEGFRLIEIKADSIKVAFERTEKYIKRNKM